VRLKKEMENLERMRPEDLADYLEKTNIRNVNKIVDSLDDEFAADVIGDLNISYQTSLFRRFAPEKAATLIDYIDPDEAVDILLTLSEEKRDDIMKLLSKEKYDELHHLIKLSKTPIGELINPDFITVSAEGTIGAAFNKIKEQITEDNFFVYIYVVNHENQLIGVFRVNQLLTQPSDAAVSDVMEQDVVVLHLTTPKEIAIKKMLRYKLYALPVIDDKKQILGVVMFDDMVEDILEKI
jgi:Mg/Co/Ni transporter MgtE